MKEELIKFETAKLAKEKKFNEIVKTAYGKSEESLYESNCTNKNSKNTFLSAPTQSLLQKWLGEVHNIHVYVTPESISKENEAYFFHIWGDEVRQHFRGVFGKKYEETLEFGLQEALKLIKTK